MLRRAWCFDVLGASTCLVLRRARCFDVPGASACLVLRRHVRGMSIATTRRVVVRRYQDLVAWQLANELKLKVYALVDQTTARDDRKFCDQIKDAAASAPRNLAEGFAYYLHPDFARYTRTAKASLVETHNHLGDGVERRHWAHQQAMPLQQLADRAVGASVRLLRHLESTDAPGTKRRRR
jgi:four helix bundle protein